MNPKPLTHIRWSLPVAALALAIVAMGSLDYSFFRAQNSGGEQETRCWTCDPFGAPRCGQFGDTVTGSDPCPENQFATEAACDGACVIPAEYPCWKCDTASGTCNENGSLQYDLQYCATESGEYQDAQTCNANCGMTDPVIPDKKCWSCEIAGGTCNQEGTEVFDLENCNPNNNDYSTKASCDETCEADDPVAQTEKCWACDEASWTCTQDAGNEVEAGANCPEGQFKTKDACSPTCAPPKQVCWSCLEEDFICEQDGNEVDDPADCPEPQFGDQQSCQKSCFCGNNKLDAGEECDPSMDDFSECNVDCTCPDELVSDGEGGCGCENENALVTGSSDGKFRCVEEYFCCSKEKKSCFLSRGYSAAEDKYGYEICGSTEHFDTSDSCFAACSTSDACAAKGAVMPGSSCDVFCDDFKKYDGNPNDLSDLDKKACAARATSDSCGTAVCYEDDDCTVALIASCPTCEAEMTDQEIYENPACICSYPNVNFCTAEVCEDGDTSKACTTRCTESYELECYVMRSGNRRVKRGHYTENMSCVEGDNSTSTCVAPRGGTSGGTSGGTTGGATQPPGGNTQNPNNNPGGGIPPGDSPTGGTPSGGTTASTASSASSAGQTQTGGGDENGDEDESETVAQRTGESGGESENESSASSITSFASADASSEVQFSSQEISEGNESSENSVGFSSSVVFSGLSSTSTLSSDLAEEDDEGQAQSVASAESSEADSEPVVSSEASQIATSSIASDATDSSIDSATSSESSTFIVQLEPPAEEADEDDTRSENDDDGDGDNDDGRSGNDDIRQPDDDETAAPTLISTNETEKLVAAAKICGDGVLTTGEECDDSNRRDNDGCSSDCQLEIGICGDGIVQKLLGEQCEPSSHDSSLPYTCERCQFASPTCGDGTVDPGEECDEGTLNSTSPNADCRPNCRFGSCGDGVLDSTELCDDGNRMSNDGCDRYCREELGAQTLVASDSVDIPFSATTPTPTQPVPSPIMAQFPMQPASQVLPFQFPLAQLQPLIQGQAPVGDTGPAAVAVIGAGAAAGWSFMRRKK